MAPIPSPAALVAITLGVVLAGAGAGVLLQPSTDRPAAAPRGPNVSIDVIAPREPELEPGSVLEVGDLAEGYVHRDYAREDYGTPRTYEVSEDDPAARVESRPIERARVVAPIPAPRPVVVERSEPQRRWPFGFDQPRPDYAAERRERLARIDDQRRLEEASLRERPDDRDDYSEPRDDRLPEVSSDRDRRGRERQWYRSDGSPVSGPDD